MAGVCDAGVSSCVSDPEPDEAWDDIGESGGPPSEDSDNLLVYNNI
jgi:hypothetical protein